MQQAAPPSAVTSMLRRAAPSLPSLILDLDQGAGGRWTNSVADARAPEAERGVPRGGGTVWRILPGPCPRHSGANATMGLATLFVLPLGVLVTGGLALFFAGFLLGAWRGWVWRQRFTQGQ